MKALMAENAAHREMTALSEIASAASKAHHEAHMRWGTAHQQTNLASEALKALVVP